MALAGAVFRGIEATGDPGARVFMDAAELRRCLHDMILNAVEASRDAAQPCIGIAIAGGDRRVAIHIADNGRGVAAQDREAIFHGQSTKTPPGGMGLSHARRAIEAYSGRVQVRESTPWERTAFEIDLCRVPS